MFCKLVLPSQEIHKLSNIPETYEELYKAVLQKLEGKISNDFILKYKDSDQELITLSCDDDIQTAVLTSQNENINTLKIFIIPFQEPVITPIQDLNLNTLPGIPEILEKSKSTITECSQVGPSRKSLEEEPPLQKPSPIKNFDLYRLPRSNSIILDEIETINSMTPFSERFYEPGKEKRIFNFARLNSGDFMNELAESISPNAGSFLSEEQIKYIDQLVEKKLGKEFQEKITHLAKDFVSKFVDDLLNQERNVMSQSGLLSKNHPRSSMRKYTLQTTKETPQENIICVSCEQEIPDIKYSCLSCPYFVCCESCESHIRHPHPLLKVRPNQLEQNGNLNNNPPMSTPIQRGNSRVFTSFPTISHIGPERNLANITKQYENSPSKKQLNLPAPPLLKRGASMGSIMTGPSSCSKLTKVAAEFESKYKAVLNKSTTYDFMTVKPGKNFNIFVTVQNGGDRQWVEPVRLVCINGIYKGNEIEVKNLQPKEEQTLTIHLQAPRNSGRYLSQWKLHYEEDGTKKAFGKAVFVDFEVVQGDQHDDSENFIITEKGESEKEVPKRTLRRLQTQPIPKDLGADINPRESLWQTLRELNCTESVYNKAKMLNDMFPGELQEKVTFIKSTTCGLDINDLVSAYLLKMGNTNKRRLTWTGNAGISTA